MLLRLLPSAADFCSANQVHDARNIANAFLMEPMQAVGIAAYRSPRVWPRWLFSSATSRRYHICLEGWAFISIMALVGVAAWHSGTNLLYLMFAMLIAFFLIQGLLVWICLKGVRVERVLPEHITACEEVLVPIVVHNRKRFFSSYALRVVDGLQPKQPLGMGFVLRIPRNSSIRTSYHAIFPHRGLFTLKHLEVLTRYPFGLVERATIFREPRQALVYPQILDVSELLTQAQVDIGEHETHKKGPGVDLYGLTEYVEGQHARHIHWRSSAKAQKLMVKEFEKEEHRRITVLLENLVTSEELASVQVRDDFETAVVFAASYVKHLISHGYDVQLVTDSGIVPYGSGARHLHRVLRALAVVQLIERAGVRRFHLGSFAALLNVVFKAQGNRDSHPEACGIDIRQWQISNRKFVRKVFA
jgi:uncharacterized protein (DUF58 family)